MHKKIILSISAIICTIVIAYTAIISTNRDNDTTDDTPLTQNKITPRTDTAPADTDKWSENDRKTYADIEGYLVQSTKDRLNIYQVYSNGYKELIQSADLSSSVLPEKDRIQLDEGIITDTYDKACSMIEDFSS